MVTYSCHLSQNASCSRIVSEILAGVDFSLMMVGCKPGLIGGMNDISVALR